LKVLEDQLLPRLGLGKRDVSVVKVKKGNFRMAQRNRDRLNVMCVKIPEHFSRDREGNRTGGTCPEKRGGPSAAGQPCKQGASNLSLLSKARRVRSTR